jgi:hypothetical protein
VSESPRDTLGLVPSFVRHKLRITEILEAMGRYNQADLAIPEDWVDELGGLVWGERARIEQSTKS